MPTKRQEAALLRLRKASKLAKRAAVAQDKAAKAAVKAGYSSREVAEAMGWDHTRVWRNYFRS